MIRTHHDDSKPRYFYAVALIIVSGFFWALVEVLGYIVPRDTSPFLTVWMRYVTHLTFMGVVLGPRYKGLLLKTGRLKLQIFRSLLMLGMPAFFIAALLSADMSLKNINSIFWVSPLLVMGLAVLILHEHVNLNRWLAALVAYAGVLILLRPDRGVVGLQALLPLGMAFCFSLYRVLTRELRTENSITNLFYTAFGVFVPLTLLIPLYWQTLTPERLGPMVLIGLVGFVALYLVDKAYEAAPASVLAPFIYSELIWYVLLTQIMLHESPAGLVIPGLVLLFLAGVYLVYSDTRASREVTLASSTPNR